MTLGLLKKIMALLLLASFFLPLSRCELIDSADLGLSPVSGEQLQTSKPITKTRYYELTPAAAFKVGKSESWIMLLVFAWPTLIWGIHLIPGEPAKSYLVMLEPFFCLGSAFYIGEALAIGEILTGGYIAAMSLTLYFLLACHEAYRNMVRKPT
ncbi:MAG: hypothetical protein OEY67_06070 [Gammaproteobacteria bacterium]|nr:hypothetical protein [Gammaproteobacteria bacterium]